VVGGLEVILMRYIIESSLSVNKKNFWYNLVNKTYLRDNWVNVLIKDEKNNEKIIRWYLISEI